MQLLEISSLGTLYARREIFGSVRAELEFVEEQGMGDGMEKPASKMHFHERVAG